MSQCIFQYRAALDKNACSSFSGFLIVIVQSFHHAPLKQQHWKDVTKQSTLTAGQIPNNKNSLSLLTVVSITQCWLQTVIT